MAKLIQTERKQHNAVEIYCGTINIFNGLIVVEVPSDKTCVIENFYIKNGKIVREGTIRFKDKVENTLCEIIGNTFISER